MAKLLKALSSSSKKGAKEVTMTPDELVFGSSNTATIDLKNTSSDRIIYKVNCTTVDRFSAKPHRGLVESKAEQKVNCE
jgi:hypothetical protein